MSVKKYVVIEIDCDECSSTYREDFLDSGSKIQVQKQAMRDGWIISGGGRRCPTWEEMCMVKDIFWGEEECVVQFHPPRSEYVNRHPYCLHLWKKIGEEYETPPKEYVG